MAQIINIFRGSIAVPIAIVIMAVGFVLVSTKKISEGCFLFLIIFGFAVLVFAPMLADFPQLRVAQLNNDASQLNLLAEQEKTKRAWLYTIGKFFALATSIVSFLFFLLRKFHFGH